VSVAECGSKWKVEPLGEVVDILDSRRVPVNSETRKHRIGDVPYYGATGQVGWIDTYLFDEELVLLGEDGAPFLDSAKPKAYLIRGKSWVNNHAHVLRAKAGLLNSFLLYQLNCTNYRPYVSGTTRLKLPQGPMKQIPLVVPEEDEQREIVAEIEKQFTRLEAGVAGLRRVQTNLKRYRAAVLKAACEGRLVPTEEELARERQKVAVASRRWSSEKKQSRGGSATQEGPGYETGAQLLERILAERQKKWNGKGKYKEGAKPDTTNLPPLPEGWVWGTAEQLTDATRPITYGVIKLGAPVQGGVPILRSSDVRHLTLDLDDVKHISPAIAGQFKRTFLRGGEILVTVRGTLGGVVVAPDVCSGHNISREVAMLVLIEPSIAKAVAMFIGSVNLQRWLLERTKGIAYTGINIETLKQLPIPVPPFVEQNRIVAEVERRLSVVEELEAAVNANLQRANRLRQSILQRCFQGCANG
jgi:type I restriction enzyme S subunit